MDTYSENNFYGLFHKYFYSLHYNVSYNIDLQFTISLILLSFHSLRPASCSFQMSSTSILYFAFLLSHRHFRPFPLTSEVLPNLLHFCSYPIFAMSILSYPPLINLPKILLTCQSPEQLISMYKFKF